MDRVVSGYPTWPTGFPKRCRNPHSHRSSMGRSVPRDSPRWETDCDSFRALRSRLRSDGLCTFHRRLALRQVAGLSRSIWSRSLSSASGHDLRARLPPLVLGKIETIIAGRRKHTSTLCIRVRLSVRCQPHRKLRRSTPPPDGDGVGSAARLLWRASRSALLINMAVPSRRGIAIDSIEGLNFQRIRLVAGFAPLGGVLSVGRSR
jgi:hypothetical protein